MTSWFHSTLVGRVVSLCCSDSLLGYSTREKKISPPMCLRWSLECVVWATGLAGPHAFCECFEMGDRVCLLGLARAGRRWGNFWVFRALFLSLIIS